MLKSVLQDWDDDRAGTILAHIRRVTPDDGRLLIIEPVLPEVVDASLPSTMYLGDLNMLVNTADESGPGPTSSSSAKGPVSRCKR